MWILIGLKMQIQAPLCICKEATRAKATSIHEARGLRDQQAEIMIFCSFSAPVVWTVILYLTIKGVLFFVRLFICKFCILFE